MKKAVAVALILVIIASFLVPAYLVNDAKASWKICTPLSEPTTTYNTFSIYDDVTGYIYQVSGKTWPGAVAQYTYAARYDTDTDTWLALNGVLDEGVGANSANSFLNYNRTNGNLYIAQNARDNDMVQMYNMSDGQWYEFASVQPWALYDNVFFHDVTNSTLYFVTDDPAGYTHATTTAGAWTNVGAGAAIDYADMWREVVVGTKHYLFYIESGGNYRLFDETGPAVSSVAYGALWQYDLWAAWYDSASGTVYGVWSPTAEAMAPENAHLCTFNTTTSIWTEGSNLGLAAYSGLPDVYDSTIPYGWFVDGYAYMVGQGSDGGTYTTGSPYFKFPVPGTFVISETNTPSDIIFNGLESNTTYYAKGTAPNNPVEDGDCTFTVTNSSGCPIDLDIKSTEYAGGNGWTMTVGVPGDDQLRITAYYSGQALSEGLVVTAVDQTFIENLDDGDHVHWDLKVELGTIVDDANKTGTITLTGSEYPG